MRKHTPKILPRMRNHPRKKALRRSPKRLLRPKEKRKKNPLKNRRKKNPRHLLLRKKALKKAQRPQKSRRTKIVQKLQMRMNRLRPKKALSRKKAQKLRKSPRVLHGKAIPVRRPAVFPPTGRAWWTAIRNWIIWRPFANVKQAPIMTVHWLLPTVYSIDCMPVSRATSMMSSMHRISSRQAASADISRATM